MTELYSSRLSPLREEAAKLLKKQDRIIIAIDGGAASGKSTSALNLSYLWGCSVIHMDDFFLPPELRTEERLKEPGGNVHYERFEEEVLPFLRGNSSFSYRLFSCKKMDFDGNIPVKPSPIIVIEGAYSHHPRFGDYADIKVFADVTPDEQASRIIMRNRANAESFFSRWIPMENRYFETFGIREKANIII